MTDFDVFNGDADGICALHQLRLAEPRKAELITGVKRDISLLKRVHAKAYDRVTVLDISLDKNRHDLNRLLNQTVDVHYFDHHFAGDIPASPQLQTHIDTAANTCTSLLVNDYLHGQFLPWAVTAAFGDNLFAAACDAAKALNLSATQLHLLEQLGTLINYNAYGVTLADLHFSPAALYGEISAYENPFDFIAQSASYEQLTKAYADDIEQARQLPYERADDAIKVIFLPDAAWTRRVAGVYGNELARSAPAHAHALITELPDGDYRISVRAPLNNKTDADVLCRQFPGGGGRKAAAGINALPAAMLNDFINAFRKQYRSS
ncbi:MAG: acetyltransferase [Mariprofundus sp.]|nr:acetyltransferase [Mariprofundus sp.]